MFQFVHKELLYHASVSHSYLKRNSFLKSGRANIRETATFQMRVTKTIIIFLNLFSLMLLILILFKCSFPTILEILSFRILRVSETCMCQKSFLSPRSWNKHMLQEHQNNNSKWQNTQKVAMVKDWWEFLQVHLTRKFSCFCDTQCFNSSNFKRWHYTRMY